MIIKLDLENVEVIDMEIDRKNYPDLVDSYIVEANYYGIPMSDEQLDILNTEYYDFIYNEAINRLF